MLAIFASLFMTASAFSATYTVTKTADTNDGICSADCSLREAIAAANAAPANDVIEFAPGVFSAPQVITLGGTELFIAKNGTLTINGPGAGQLIVSGNNTSRVFRTEYQSTVAISRITVANGNSTSTSSTGPTGGGGGGILNYGLLTLAEVVVRNNSAVFVGGGVSNYGFGGTLITFGSTFSNNTSGNAGGGIYTTGNGTLQVSGSSFTDNGAPGGGGIRVYNGTATIIDSDFTGNRATLTGGGISSSGTTTVSDSTLTNNTANNGAGIANGRGNQDVGQTGMLTLNNSTVRANSTVNGNPQTNAGGGLYNVTGGTMTVNNSTVSGNSTTNTGAGIYNRNTLTLNNSTISSNTGSLWGGGGGVRVEGSAANATLNSSTVANNSAAISGGGISVVEGAVATLNNTIVADSQSASGDCFNSGSTVNAEYSLIESGLSCVNGTNSNNVTGDPQLGPLADNGGPTFTHALLAFSPAIDKGNSMLASDQRGFPRPVDLPNYSNTGNAADLGAYELQQEYDRDGDGSSDLVDNCLDTPNADQANSDNDAAGNACDEDDDNDGVTDGSDAFPLDPNESVDTDGDGIGNNADTDDDGDGQSDVNETACGSNPLDAASKSADADGDSLPDCVDADDDNDNVPDSCDVDQNPGAVDFDRDGIVDSSQCDTRIGPPVDKEQCKNGGWVRFNSPTFRNQGDCVSFVVSNRP
jgi:CSLREA domain-containing protein